MIVGVNAFTAGNEEDEIPTLVIGPEVEARQIERLRRVRRQRDEEAQRTAIRRLVDEARDPERNLMPALIDAARARASVGEVMMALGEVFGLYEEPPR